MIVSPTYFSSKKKSKPNEKAVELEGFATHDYLKPWQHLKRLSVKLSTVCALIEINFRTHTSGSKADKEV